MCFARNCVHIIREQVGPKREGPLRHNEFTQICSASQIKELFNRGTFLSRPAWKKNCSGQEQYWPSAAAARDQMVCEKTQILGEAFFDLRARLS
jgi:hypothetical protein